MNAASRTSGDRTIAELQTDIVSTGDPTIAELQAVREQSRQLRVQALRLRERRDVAIRAALAAGHTRTKVAHELDVTRQFVASRADRSPT